MCISVNNCSECFLTFTAGLRFITCMNVNSWLLWKVFSHMLHWFLPFSPCFDIIWSFNLPGLKVFSHNLQTTCLLPILLFSLKLIRSDKYLNRIDEYQKKGQRSKEINIRMDGWIERNYSTSCSDASLLPVWWHSQHRLQDGVTRGAGEDPPQQHHHWQPQDGQYFPGDIISNSALPFHWVKIITAWAERSDADQGQGPDGHLLAAGRGADQTGELYGGGDTLLQPVRPQH